MLPPPPLGFSSRACLLSNEKIWYYIISRDVPTFIRHPPDSDGTLRGRCRRRKERECVRRPCFARRHCRRRRGEEMIVYPTTEIFLTIIATHFPAGWRGSVRTWRYLVRWRTPIIKVCCWISLEDGSLEDGSLEDGSLEDGPLEDGGCSLLPLVRLSRLLVLPANQYYYEEGCEGLGCNIFGENDCRQCLFDRTAYANVSEGCLPPPPPTPPSS